MNWYVAEFNGSSLSGTGEVADGYLNLNVIGDSIDMRKAVSSIPSWARYIAAGEADLRARVFGELSSPLVNADMSVKGLKVRNFAAMESFLERMSGARRSPVDLGDVNADLQLRDDRVQVRQLTASGGDIEGNLRGSYYWDGRIDLTIRPEFFGTRFTLLVHGDTENVRINLR